MRSMKHWFLPVIAGLILVPVSAVWGQECTAVTECPDGSVVTCAGSFCEQGDGYVMCDGILQSCPVAVGFCRDAVVCAGAICQSHRECGTGKAVGDSCEMTQGVCTIICTNSSGFHCCGCKARTVTALKLKTLENGQGLEISWTTEAEPGIEGFDVYRTSLDGVTERVNLQLLQARGTDRVGADYVLVDATGGVGFIYHLEAVETGERRIFEQVKLECGDASE